MKYDEHCKIFVSSRISTWREKKVDKNLYLFLHVHICTREFEFDQSLGFFSFSFAIKSIIFIGSAKIHQEQFDFAIIFFGYCFEAKNIVNYYYRLVPWPQFERSCACKCLYSSNVTKTFPLEPFISTQFMNFNFNVFEYLYKQPKDGDQWFCTKNLRSLLLQ